MDTQQFLTRTRDICNSAVNYIKDNPGEILLFAVGVMMLDIDTTLEQIEEHEEIQSAFDVWQYNNTNGGV